MNSSDPVEAVVDHSRRPPVADCASGILLFITQCDGNLKMLPPSRNLKGLRLPSGEWQHALTMMMITVLPC